MGRLEDGRAVFIPLAMPGELVRIRLVEEKRNFARAELVEIVEASPERIKPRCRHFGECGGCHYQHIPYSLQLQAKEMILRDQLQRIGKIKQPPVEATRPSPDPFQYRNYIQFHLDDQGRLGFEAARSNRVVPIQECHLPQVDIDSLWRQLQIEPVPGLDRVGLRSGYAEQQLILERKPGSAGIQRRRPANFCGPPGTRRVPGPGGQSGSHLRNPGQAFPGISRVILSGQHGAG